MNLIVTLTGMSTSGKSTLAKSLTDSGNFKEATSVTTRPMRPGEVNGVDYYFVDNKQFNEFVLEGEFLEFVQSHHASYGVLSSEVEKILGSGKSPVLVIEPIGVDSMNKIALERNYNMLSCYVNTDIEVIMSRFMGRIYGQISAGKSVNYNQEAKRLQTMMTIERTWEKIWNWDMMLNNLHKKENMLGSISTLTDHHHSLDSFKPVEKSMKSIRAPQFKAIEDIEKIIKETVEASISCDQFYNIVGKSMKRQPEKTNSIDPSL